MPDRYEPDPQITEFNKRVDQTVESIDETVAALMAQAKAQRRYALLQAAATLFGSHNGWNRDDVVVIAEQLLAEIEEREAK